MSLFRTATSAVLLRAFASALRRGSGRIWLRTLWRNERRARSGLPYVVPPTDADMRAVERMVREHERRA